MDESSLQATLEEAFRQLDDIANQHRQALAFDATLERTEYVRGRLHELCEALNAFRLACQANGSQGEGYGAGDRQRLWSRTCADLRDAMPEAFADPGQPLVAGDLALLGMVSYLGAALALVHERHELAMGLSG